MSLLLDALPETVCIDGVDVRINNDFRTGVLFEQLMFDDDCPESVKPSVDILDRACARSCCHTVVYVLCPP